MMNPNQAHYVVVTAIIIKDGKYLIAKRADHEKVFPNKWTVPGGKLERDDYEKRDTDTGDHWYNVFETLVRREVDEEVGLEIKNIQYLTSLSFIRPDNIPVVVVSLYADIASGQVKLCKDLIEYKWVTLTEARECDLIEGIYEEIEMLENKLKGKHTGEWKKS